MKLWRSYKEQVLALSLVLSAIGLFNVYNSSYVEALSTENNSFYFLLKQISAGAVGLLLAAFLSKSRKVCRWLADVKLQYVLIVVVILLLIAVKFFGITVNGSKRWLKLGITFQPSEIAKFCAVFLSAAYIERYFGMNKRKRIIPFINPALALTAIAAVIVLTQPDFGTAVIIIVASLLLFLIAGISHKTLSRVVIFGAGVVALTVYMAPYRMERVYAWLNPWQYAQGIGYQSCQSMLTVGSGKIIGMPFGMGLSKFFYLPEAHTDFAFAIWAQESGFLGSVFLIALFVAFARVGIKIAQKAEGMFNRMAAIGITFLITGQAFVNIAMVTGVLPVVGVPLPFVSYGGTSLVINWIAAGILANIAGNIKERETSREIVKR